MTANALQKNVKKQLFRIGQIAKENFGSVSNANTPRVLFVQAKVKDIFINQFCYLNTVAVNVAKVICTHIYKLIFW